MTIRHRVFASLSVWWAVSTFVSGCRDHESTAPALSAKPTPAGVRFDFKPPPPSGAHPPLSPSLVATPQFTDVASEAGIVHVYENGACGRELMVEAMGGGAGWLDFDNDGWNDLLLTQGGDPTASDVRANPSDRLFRNLGAARFDEVTQHAWIDERKYGQGIAVADFDNDGFDDVYVTNVGPNCLLHNQGDGTFVEVTGEAGVGDPRWSTTAGWGDLDLDGDLDLYVCNYADYDPLQPKPCPGQDGRPKICHPREVEPVPDECYANLGDGTFQPVAARAGLVGPGNRALGVVIADLTGDQRPDVYVANDTTPNFLFVNSGGFTFQESALRLGGAVSALGANQASMGVALGDFDRNGWLDLYLTHFTAEYNTLYVNRGGGMLEDVTSALGLREPTLSKLGFGTVMADFNQDGWDELFVTNGHIDPQSADGDGYAMSPQLLCWNGTTWRDGSADAGPFFRGRFVGRAVAACDFDRDGDMDLAVVHQNAPLALLRNDSARGRWLKVTLIGRASNRRGVGARVVLRGGEKVIVQELAGGTSYCAAHEPALIFGLGAWQAPCALEVHWPSGLVQHVSSVGVDQSVVISEPDAAAGAGLWR
jgi:hypothetical protein